MKTVQQKNIEPKKVHLSGLWSHIDLNPYRIFSSTSLTMSSCVQETFSGSMRQMSINIDRNDILKFLDQMVTRIGGQFTSEVLDGADNLTQEQAVILLSRGSAPSFNVLKQQRTKRCVCHQSQTQQNVWKESPKTRRAFSRLGFNVNSLFQFY